MKKAQYRMGGSEVGLVPSAGTDHSKQAFFAN